MPVSFTLLTLSFALIHHYVCSWNVSEPLNHTLNDDGSVSVTCLTDETKGLQWECKLKMNDAYVCELYKDKQQNDMCKWQHSGNACIFTLLNPKAIHTNLFSCVISRVKPRPVITKQGPQTKLFPDRCNHLPRLMTKCSCTNQTEDDKSVERTPTEDTYTFVIIVLIIVLVFLSTYSTIVTAVYLRLKDKRLESSDTLTYVPMQRNVKRRDQDNTEYVDMRKVQKQGGSHRDVNHNSHVIPSVQANF